MTSPEQTEGALIEALQFRVIVIVHFVCRKMINTKRPEPSPWIEVDKMCVRGLLELCDMFLDLLGIAFDKFKGLGNTSP
jgi:hypothetical protein